MHVSTRNKVAARQSLMQIGERTSVWELIHAFQRSKSQIRPEMQPHLWAARQAKIARDMGMERWTVIVKAPFVRA
jgi:hypothetical protein